MSGHRSRQFWEVIIPNHFDDRLWLRHFRVTKTTFQMLCNEIGLLVSPLMPSHRTPVLTEKRIAIVLYKLATCAEYGVVWETFGVNKTTVHRCVYSVCRAICAHMMSSYIKLPDLAEAREIAERNYTTHHIPQVYGALDGTHILVLAPAEGYRDYVNRNGWPSIILQALVDDCCLIRDVSVLVTSDLYSLLFYGDTGSVLINHVYVVVPMSLYTFVPLLIAGDPAYPLLPWLMKGFSSPSLSAEKADINLHLNGSRVKVEHTFGRLKSRWRVLAKRSDIDYKFMPTVVVACWVLHNLCEREKQRPHRVHEKQPLEPLAQPPPRDVNAMLYLVLRPWQFEMLLFDT
uniref:DDE Tnp4 domain-containing protein n=1 Tax=Sinocyclocheilus rhinocerous TaxID=307959 RepID=A0A673HX22_9TELE